MSNLDKRTVVNMENTAGYQPRSNLNVAFSTADRESAVFVFNITKGSKPLLLSSENVTGHIALKHSDGSFVKDTLHFTEPDINGRLEYYIPNEMLKRQGTVTMQVFISEKGNSNVTVAERIVTFDIEKSIVSQISAETKLQYIVEYDELQAILTERINAIEEQMANAEDYVTQLKQAKEQGLSDIEIAKADSVKALNDLADKRLEEINNKANEYSSKLDDDKQYMDDKHQAFKESVLNSEVVTRGESEEWQKYKFTNDDGNYPLIDLQNKTENYYGLKTGVYYTTNTPHNISGVSTDGFSEMKIRINSTVKKLTFKPYNSNRIFEKWFYNEWSDWKEVVTLSPDEEIETQNSAESRANETLADANQYTDEQLSKQHTVLFEGTANGVGTTVNLSESMDNFYVLLIYASTPGGSHVDIVSPYGSETIFVKSVNLPDNGNVGGAIFECGIQKSQRNQLTIIHDVSLDLSNFQASGPSANKVTIKRIVGVRK